LAIAELALRAPSVIAMASVVVAADRLNEENGARIVLALLFDPGPKKWRGRACTLPAIGPRI
jgi:hypothetical protein